jgi:hypothetical protein
MWISFRSRKTITARSATVALLLWVKENPRKTKLLLFFLQPVAFGERTKENPKENY